MKITASVRLSLYFTLGKETALEKLAQPSSTLAGSSDQLRVVILTDLTYIADCYHHEYRLL